MDDRKKEAIYELGCCFEAMGSPEKAIDEYKLVYSADISFRDALRKNQRFLRAKLLSSRSFMAEREGFEPPYLSAHPISSRAHSTTLPPLQSWAVVVNRSPLLSNLGIIEKKESWRSFLFEPSGKTPDQKRFSAFTT